jgi:hypothetical protein
MATRFYLHRAAKSLGSGTLPTTEQSTRTQVLLHDALANNKDMNTTISAVAQTSFATAMAITTANKIIYVGRWVSDFLSVTSIAANTWTMNFACQAGNGLNSYPVTTTASELYVNAYVWRPSTNAKVGTIRDGTTTTTGNSAETAEKVAHVTFAGSAVTCQANDVIIVEIWFTVNAVSNATYTCTFYYDGTTVNTTDGTTVSNHAAFVETPQNSLFAPPEITATSDNKDILKPRTVIEV